MIRPVRTPADSFVAASLDDARALIGEAMRSDGDGALPVASLGEITLMPHQRDAVRRLRSALLRFGGALLADDVGLGKTFVALAVAREYPRAHVLAPASLIAMWQAAAARAGSRNLTVQSLHEFSTTRAITTPDTSGAPVAGRGLVIIDEAHYLRNGNTARYRGVSAFVTGRDVLLLSATPLHNASSDLRNVLGLFAGTRADLLDPASLAQLIVRREGIGALEGDRPEVIEHAARPVPFDPETLSGLIALPAPLPAHEGAVAGALIRLGLLRAWCSSDAALTRALERRLLRGSALQHALESGRHPTNAELRTWLVGDSDVQLAFPELMATQHVASGPLLAVLSQHVRAVGELLAHHRRCSRADPVRARELRGMLDAHPGVPVLAFSQFTSTIRALYRALGDIAGVGAMTSERGHIASGPVTRGDVLARFAPIAQGVPPPPPHQALRLLLATDVLAEGVNLQDAGVIVHLDTPWTDALLRQRVGRVVRIRSAHRQVHVHAFAIPDDVEREIRLLERVHQKAQHGFRLVGGEGTPQSAAVLESWVRSRLDEWRVLPRTRARAPEAIALHVGAALSGTDSACWLALIRMGDQRRLVTSAAPHPHAGDARDARDGTSADDAPGIVRDDVRSVAHMIDLVDAVGACASMSGSARRSRAQRSHLSISRDATPHAARALEAIRDWLDARILRRDAGAQPTATSAVHRRVERQVHAVIASAPSVHRARFVRLADDVSAMLACSRGVGAEHSLEAWYATRSALAPDDWLSSWTRYPSLAPGAPAAASCEPRAGEPRAGEQREIVRSPLEAVVEVLILLAAPRRAR